MKKIIYLLGIVAFMAACSANTASKETTQEEGTEMEVSEDTQEMMIEEAPADSIEVSVADSVEVVAE